MDELLRRDLEDTPVHSEHLTVHNRSSYGCSKNQKRLYARLLQEAGLAVRGSVLMKKDSLYTSPEVAVAFAYPI